MLHERRMASWNAFVSETERRNADARTRVHDGLFGGLDGVPDRFADMTVSGFSAIAGDGKDAAINAIVTMGKSGIIVGSDGVERKSVLMWGDRGMGKTGLLTPLFSWLSRGKSNLWIGWYDFLAAIRMGFGDSGDGLNEARIMRAMTVDVLMLDDVGDPEASAPARDFAREVMRRIIYRRHGADMTTLITSNLTPDGMRKQFSYDVTARLSEMSAIIELRGKQLRRNG